MEYGPRAKHSWQRANAAVLAGNYGEASALEHYGRGRLPLVLSGHLSWQYWRPASLLQRYVVTVGLGEHPSLCARSQIVARIDNGWHIANEEQGRTIDVCKLGEPLGAFWASSVARNQL